MYDKQKLKNNIDIIMGQAPKSSECNKEGKGIPFIKAGEFRSIYPIVREWTTMSRKESKEGDILICVVGATAGKLNLGINAAIGRSVAALRCDKERLNNKYLYFYLNTWIKKLRDISQGSAINVITKDMIDNIEIPLPSLEIQEKVVDILEEAQKLIDKRKEQIEALDQLVKSRFIDMFGEISDYVTISEYISSLTAGKSLAGESDCKNKVLNTGSVSYDYFDETQVKNLPHDYCPKEEHLVNEGDVLISRMNTPELVGATAYVWRVKENIYIPDRLWKANFKPDVNPIFVWQLLIQKSTKDKISRIASGTSGSMKNISKARLLDLEVINVDINMQNKFADFVKQVSKLKNEMEDSLKKLENNFNSLMQKAFNGEL